MSHEQTNPGLETLIEFGAVRARATSNLAREAIINCIGCKLQCSSPAETTFNASEISECSGIEISTISSVLRRLENANVFKSNLPKARGHGRATRVEFTIAPTEVGDAFAETVAPPDICLAEY